MYRQASFIGGCRSVAAWCRSFTPGDRIVLAYGEVTGHAHAVSVMQAQMYADGDVATLWFMRQRDLVHEEHSTIHLPPGVYRVVQQREYVQAVHVWCSTKSSNGVSRAFWQELGRRAEFASGMEIARGSG